MALAVALKKIRCGRYYRPGEEIELKEAELNRLLALGAVKKAEKTASKAVPPKIKKVDDAQKDDNVQG